MQLKEAVSSRKSVRKFSNKKVDWRKIIRAIDYARAAPAAGNNFVNSFILVSDKKKIKVLAEASQQEFVGSVDYAVIVLTDENVLTRTFEDRGKVYAPLQTGAAIENFLLGLAEQKLDTCWVGYFYEEQIKDEFKIPDKLKVEAIFPIGKELKGKVEYKAQKKKLETILYFDKFGNKTMVPIKKVSSESC